MTKPQNTTKKINENINENRRLMFMAATLPWAQALQ
jgi:hypothetical protein